MPTVTEDREARSEERVRVWESARVPRAQKVQQVPQLLQERPLFADSLLDPGKQERNRRKFATVVSFIFQCLLIGTLPILPLMFMEALPQQQLLTFLVAPPAPPPPPPDLLLSAVASCYTTTFNALADYSKLEYADLEVEVEGVIRKTDSGYSFSEIALRPKLTVSVEQEQTRALRLLQKAKTLCLVSRALSVEQRFEPRVQLSEARAESSRVVPAM